MKLFTSRSKVTPIRCLSIPRLELAAANLLNELMLKVKSSLRCDVRSVHFWTESQVVLWWLKKPSSTFKPFVANRIAFIQESSNVNEWHHIPGDQNPADIVSRGASVTDLLKSSLWFNGTEFLLLSVQDWPPQNITFDFTKSDPDSEIKKNAVVMISSKDDFDTSNMFQVNHIKFLGSRL